MDLRHTVDRIQALVSAETGRRLGPDAETALSQLLRNSGSGNGQRQDGFAYRELTILFADLRGFMAISDRYPPRTVLQVLNRLTDLGNTIIIIEHNLDVVKQADWIIDLGPEGGDAGGRIVAQGTPEEVARVQKSFTGQALAKVLANGRVA